MEKHVTLLCYNNNNEIETIKTDIVAMTENNKLCKEVIEKIFGKYPNTKIIENKIWENTDEEIFCRTSTRNIYFTDSVIIGCYLYHYDKIRFVPLPDNKYDDINYMTPILNYYNDYVREVHITDISKIFKHYSLRSLDLSKFDTSNVTDMSKMFICCDLYSIKFGDKFNTSNVTNMRKMFAYCDKLTSLNLLNFDTSNVTNMNGMFCRCDSLQSLDLSKFDTSNVTNMNGMFYECSNLTQLDVSSFDTSNVTNMSNMFNDCDKLKIITASPKFLIKHSNLFKQII